MTLCPLILAARSDGMGGAVEGRGIAGKERARGILEADAIARHRRHEAVGSVLRCANAVLADVGAHGMLDELAQRDRRAAGLARQPVPMTRQQRHLVRDNAEFRAAGTARRVAGGWSRSARCRVPRQARRSGFAQIDLDRLAGRGIEDENGLVLVALGGFLRRQRHAGEVARGDADVALEGNNGGLFGHERRLGGWFA